jgi:hypothetical protein
MGQPLVIQYTNLLHKHGRPDAEAVREFLKNHSGDPVFVRRAEVLNHVFKLRDTDLAASGPDQPNTISARRSTASS